LAALAIAGCNSPTVAPVDGPASGGMTWPRPPRRIDKLDLLFVVDNSPRGGMADAQAELARSVPGLLGQLTDQTSDPETGTKLGLVDIHVGVITSSLGSHGTSICDPTRTNAHDEERAHLLPRDGEPCGVGVAASSAIGWTYAPREGVAFTGEEGRTKLATATACVLEGVKDDGCTYSETWESVYHFLVDPKPYASAKVKCTFTDSGDACGSNKIEVSGVDEELLAERKAFLRQDSLLAVVVVSNENDVSLKPAGLNWLPWGYQQGEMQRGWESCANVPDDFEPESAAEFDTLHAMFGCRSCFEDGSDPRCKSVWPASGTNLDVDDRNLRGFAQVQRYGYNFLWGRQRYVQAFSNAQAIASDGSLGINPVFAGGFRTKDLVIVQAIVGVPKSLVSDGDLPRSTLGEADWDKLVGPIGKRDPHMIESIGPRAGLPKFAGDRSVDDVNGGERDTLGDDLQYACIARRAVTTNTKDCEAPDAALRNPLCDASEQPYFKAYPGLRHLRIVHDLGASGLVASICDQSFAAALAALGKKIEDALAPGCLSSEIGVKDGRASCMLFESLAADGRGRTCEELGKGLCTVGAAPCRVEGSDSPPVDRAKAAAQLTLRITVVDPITGVAANESVTGTVDGPNVVVIGSDGKKHLACELEQLVSPDPNAARCQNDKIFRLDPATAGGWCYSTNPAVLPHGCNLGVIRFGGGAVPRENAELSTLCLSGG
jgi:hypothetical protein